MVVYRKIDQDTGKINQNCMGVPDNDVSKDSIYEPVLFQMQMAIPLYDSRQTIVSHGKPLSIKTIWLIYLNIKANLFRIANLITSIRWPERTNFATNHRNYEWFFFLRYFWYHQILLFYGSFVWIHGKLATYKPFLFSIKISIREKKPF